MSDTFCGAARNAVLPEGDSKSSCDVCQCGEAFIVAVN